MQGDLLTTHAFLITFLFSILQSSLTVSDTVVECFVLICGLFSSAGPGVKINCFILHSTTHIDIVTKISLGTPSMSILFKMGCNLTIMKAIKQFGIFKS